jgi:hypothetical protein
MATKLEAFRGSQFTGKIVLADVEFFDTLAKINQFAADNGLEIYVTSSARQQGVTVGGAIVPPASRSNHLVGHAIDMNVMLRGSLFTSRELKNFTRLPQEIQKFIQSIRDANLRWGGDFSDPDPVHIDDGLNLRDRDAWDEKFPIIQSQLIALMQRDNPPREPRLLQLTRPLMKGEDVCAVQRALIKLGFDLDEDCKYGSMTDAAVTAFQESKGLTADGIVGSSTRQALGIS